MAKPEPGSVTAAQNWPQALLLVGCGNMAGAMLGRWLEYGLPPERVTVVRPSGRPVADGVTVMTTLPDVIAPDTLVLLGHKPQQLPDIAPPLEARLGAGATIFSILAGVSTTQLAAVIPQAGAHVRAMPNMPVRSGHGVVSLFVDPSVPAHVRDVADLLCRPLGLVAWLEDEALFDAATALAGCGPAYVYRFIDALAKAGEAVGLSAEIAAHMALATVEGAALTAAVSKDAPGALADAVASKGGMTREGLDVLDRADGLAPLIEATLRAARDRGAELARLAAGPGKA
ncbi:pyrroline-5-carboxylate reductase family protein [Sphingobium sp. CR28]|uniref:pyrroline-5-carboxylate reductase family protein n=1 Tax=Sphingobium sp. CR28 TaxID=3400272 RepID=UPI003FF0B318